MAYRWKYWWKAVWIHHCTKKLAHHDIYTFVYGVNGWETSDASATNSQWWMKCNHFGVPRKTSYFKNKDAQPNVFPAIRDQQIPPVGTCSAHLSTKCATVLWAGASSRSTCTPLSCAAFEQTTVALSLAWRVHATPFQVYCKSKNIA